MVPILTFFLAFYLTCILTFYLAFYVVFYLTFCLAFYLTFYLKFYLTYILTFYLAFYVVFYLTFYLASILIFNDSFCHTFWHYLTCVPVQARSTACWASDMLFGSRPDPLHPELAEGMNTTKRQR